MPVFSKKTKKIVGLLRLHDIYSPSFSLEVMDFISKKLLSFVIISVITAAAVYLIFHLKNVYDEFAHWKSKEEVLEKELNDLREEANSHRKFLEKLRSDPEFQDAVARKELGYGDKEERLYRFSK